MYHTIVKVMGKIPVLIAWAFRKKNGFPLEHSSKISCEIEDAQVYHQYQRRK